MRLNLPLCFVTLLFLPTATTGQISITDQDLLGLIGSTFILEEDTSGMLVIDHGTAGENQTWDLSGPLNTSFSITREFVAPSETPYAGRFTTANLAEKLTSFDFSEGAFYNFYEVGPNRAIEVGNVAVVYVMGTMVENVNEDLHLVAPLPLTTVSAWTETIKDTTIEVGAFTSILFDSTVISVDGWGKIILPGGEFDCLRLFEQCWTHSQTVINGVIIDSSWESALSYIWVDKNHFVLAAVTSQDGETDPNFTSASAFSRLAGGSTALSEIKDLGQQLNISGPNPFKDKLQIRVDLDQANNVRLSIFDLQGVEVTRLMDSSLADGTYHFSWDGRSKDAGLLSAGTYLVALRTDEGRAVRKTQFIH